MKSEAAEFPTQQLHIDLDVQDVTATGFWWCRKCHRISEAVDPGDPYPQCAHCKRRNTLVWKEPLPDVPRKKVVTQVPPGDHAHTLFLHMLDVVENAGRGSS